MTRLSKKEKPSRSIGHILIFASVLSFFCGDLSIDIGFTLRPFHIVAAISLLYLLLVHKGQPFKTSFSKIDRLFMIFFLISFIGALFSPFSAASSFKHILGIVLLFCSFCIFKMLYCRYKIEEVMDIVSAAGVVIIVTTIVWYIIGIFSLGFNFNVGDTFCFGVRIDRKIPRLVSFAYNEPNYVSIYFAALFAYYLGSKRSAINIFGLIGSMAIIALTMSRGGYIALAAAILVYVVFSKEKRKEIFTKTLIIVSATAVSLICLTIIMNTRSSDSNSTLGKTASAVMIERFSKSVSDNGSNRLIHWQDAVETFKQYPILGIGPGNIIDYKGETYGRPSPSHNSYLDVMAEQGVLGGMVYLALLVGILVYCWKVRYFTIVPAVSFTFLFVSELFLSLAVTDMLFINILILDLSLEYWKRKKNYEIVNSNIENEQQKKTEKTKVSFIVPVYNVENYLKRCLDSLTIQSGINFEVIIVNDGSTDGSPELCKKYAKENKAIRYYETKNNGLSSARNYGAGKATGEYLWFIDGDDFISNDALKRIRSFLNHDVVTVGYYNYYNDYSISDGNDSNERDDIARYIINPALAPLKIVKREIFVKNKIKFAIGKNYEDVGIMYSLINFTKDIYHSGERVYFYRRRQNSISATFNAKNFSDHLWATEQICRELGKGYDQEVEYQAITQLLFSAFDINRTDERQQRNYYFEQVRRCLEDNSLDYVHNKYFERKGKKNYFYRIYLSKLIQRKYSFLVCMNYMRKKIIERQYAR